MRLNAISRSLQSVNIINFANGRVTIKRSKKLIALQISNNDILIKCYLLSKVLWCMF